MNVSKLVKETNIIRVLPDDSLSSTMAKLSSSHDAAFVFSEEGAYLGLVSPYHSIIKSSLPSNTKVQHCIFHAPHVELSMTVGRVAELMIESKVHYLPVFREKEFIGIISARRMLSVLRDSAVFSVSIRDILRQKKHNLVTIHEDDFVSQALHILKTYKISKLVVIGSDMKLKGILTYYDLISFLVAPKEKEQGSRMGDKVSIQRQKVKNFMKTRVLTLYESDRFSQALSLILDKNIGSVVVIDPEKHPTGIITSREYLSFVARHQRSDRIEVVSKDLSQKNKNTLGGFFSHLSTWLEHLPSVAKARLFVKEEKSGGVFKVVLSLFQKKGKPVIIHEEGKNLEKVLHEVKKEKESILKHQ